MKSWQIAITLAALTHAGAAYAEGRETALMTHFKTWCLAEPVSFENLNKRAAAKGFAVPFDKRTPLPNGDLIESKVWEATDDTSGTYALMGTLGVKDGKIRETSCGVGTHASRDTLLALMKKRSSFGNPIGTKEVPGARGIVWKGPYPNSEVHLIELNSGTPRAQVMIKLEQL